MMHRITHIEPMRLRRDANVDLSQHVLNTRWERSTQQSLSRDTRVEALQAIAQPLVPLSIAAAHVLQSKNPKYLTITASKGSNRKKRAPLGATAMAWMALVCVEELDTRSRVQFSTSWDQFHSYGTHV